MLDQNDIQQIREVIIRELTMLRARVERLEETVRQLQLRAA